MRSQIVIDSIQSRFFVITIVLLICFCSSSISGYAQPDLHSKALQAYKNFTSMNDAERMNAAANMTSDEMDMIMTGAAQMTREVNETIAAMSPAELEKATILLLRSGNFSSPQNETQAQGIAKILSVNDNQFLRFENFKITNGPDLHVYFTNGIDIKSGMELGYLKGNTGAQNYFLGEIANKYDTVVIASKPFGIIFASSFLKS